MSNIFYNMYLIALAEIKDTYDKEAEEAFKAGYKKAIMDIAKAIDESTIEEL